MSDFCEEGLIHYSSLPLKQTDLVDLTSKQITGFKPRGLWVSVGDAWRTWCEENEFSLHTLKSAHKVLLKKKSGVLWVCDEHSLQLFRNQYEVCRSGYEVFQEIDWPRVAEKYTGIVISPYRWNYRLDLLWYYGWDVASGCIWNPTAVKTITEM